MSDIVDRESGTFYMTNQNFLDAKIQINKKIKKINNCHQIIGNKGVKVRSSYEEFKNFVIARQKQKNL